MRETFCIQPHRIVEGFVQRVNPNVTHIIVSFLVSVIRVTLSFVVEERFFGNSHIIYSLLQIRVYEITQNKQEKTLFACF